MNSEIIYKSEPYCIRLVLSYIIALVTGITIAFFTYWIIKSAILEASFGRVFTSIYMFLLLGTPFLLSLRYIFRVRPQLIVYPDKLSVGLQTISFLEIKDIIVDRQEYSTTEGYRGIVIINLNTGYSITIIVTRYSNGSLFRLACEKIKASIVNETFTISYLEIPETKVILNSVTTDKLSKEVFKKFKPYLFFYFGFYFNAFILAVSVLILMVSIKDTKYSVNLICFAVLIAGVLRMNRIQRYYLVSENYLLIKSYFYFWDTTAFYIKDIKKIQIFFFGTGGQLHIMTRDYRMHKFEVDNTIFGNKAKEMVEMVQKNIPDYNDGEDNIPR